VAAKHGLVGFTKAIALEGAPLGITANAICPGYVKTPLVEKQVAAQARAHQLSEAEVVEKVILAKQAIKAYIPISAIAEMALFLASKKAATLTGATLAIDAGWSAQ
jgi:3-hydroxybutyrate dehydrogenase